MKLHRSEQAEIMDDFSIQDERIDQALRELTVINTWLGGHTTSRTGVRRFVGSDARPKRLSILDLGAGGSDLTYALSPMGIDVSVTSLDLNIRACEYSARRYPAIGVVQGSAFHLPFKERSFDIVHASMVLHHFTEPELHRLLGGMYAVARLGIVINDLRRSAFAYVGIKALTQLFSNSAMVKHDAPLSVLRGFTRREIERVCDTLPSAECSVNATWAFRWLVCIRKP